MTSQHLAATQSSAAHSTAAPPPLGFGRRTLLLSCALLAWLCAGILMAVPPLAARPAVAAMGVTDEASRARWFSWLVCAFLLGAAAGGLTFGWLGDRIGRGKALGASVLTYSLLAGACYFVTTPEQLLALWFLACTGVGGAWPNGVSLAAEALPGMSRPWIAGLFGATANLGLMLLALAALWRPITAGDWRWVMLVSAAPAALGLVVLAFVPESPAWLASRRTPPAGRETSSSAALLGEVFRPPLVWYTAIGIVLGAVPLMGNWGASNWLVPWAHQVQELSGEADLSAWTQWTKSGGGAVGSLLGGWFAWVCGRRTAYFLVSLLSLGSSSYIFHYLSPDNPSFLTWVFAQGFFGNIYLGWLPLYLPELFPTHVRATGTGVAFNWGRVATAAGVLAAGELMRHFDGDYARVGQATCLVYALGMVAICFAPDTTRLRRFACGLLAMAAFTASTARGDEPASGRAIYERRCASCHGDQGQGAAEHYERPLAGERSPAELAGFIAKSMPSDMPGTCSEVEARRVAAYIYDAFYSAEAQARRSPPRIELARLTARQYAGSIADLMVAFFDQPTPDAERGLQGHYATIDANGNGKRVLSRIDPEVKFDFGLSSPKPDEIDPADFAISWTGSIRPPATGEYEFIVRSPNSFRLMVNDRKTALIDAWVKSGQESEHRRTIGLLAGRRYRLELYFTKSGQGVKKPEQLRAKIEPAAISLSWKPPGRSEEIIPRQSLSPHEVREMLLLATPFPPDDRSTGFERGTAVSPEWDQAATNAALEAAAYVRERLGDYCGVVEPEKQHEPSLREFCRRFAERAFRRPLTPELQSLYVDRQFERAPDLTTAVERVVLIALKSPRFLYLNQGARADAYDFASRLSFALWDSLPDGQLLGAAAGGRLAGREQLAAQAERMTADPRFDAKLRGFFLEWLKVDSIRELKKDPQSFPGFNAEIAADLRTSFELTLDEMLSADGADFRKLLLADEVYLNGRLAPLYGAELPGDAPFRKIALNRGERAGILTHPYLMAALADANASSPIRRGVLVARSLLGRTLRPPPDAVTPTPAALHPDLTTRERAVLQTAAESCQACHALINPLGFPLERFDALGRLRSSDNQRPVDANGTYLTRGGETAKFDGARQLAEFLAASDEVHAALVEKLFYCLIKQPIRAYGPEALPALRRRFAERDFNLRRLAAEIAVLAALGPPQPTPSAPPPAGN